MAATTDYECGKSKKRIRFKRMRMIECARSWAEGHSVHTKRRAVSTSPPNARLEGMRIIIPGLQWNLPGVYGTSKISCNGTLVKQCA